MYNLESKKIIISDEEMETLGTKIDSQYYLFDGKTYKLNGSANAKANYYTEIKGDKLC